MKYTAILSAVAAAASASNVFPRYTPAATPTPTPTGSGSGSGTGELTECQESAIAFLEDQPLMPSGIDEFSSEFYQTGTATVDECAWITNIPGTFGLEMATWYVDTIKYEDDNAELWAELSECLDIGGEDSGTTVECPHEWWVYQKHLSERYPKVPPPEDEVPENEDPVLETPECNNGTTGQEEYYEGGGSPERTRGGNGTSPIDEPIQAGASGMRIATAAAGIVASIIGFSLF